MNQHWTVDKYCAADLEPKAPFKYKQPTIVVIVLSLFMIT